MKIVVTSPNHEYLEQYETYKVFSISQSNFTIKTGIDKILYCDIHFKDAVMVDFSRHFLNACSSSKASFLKNSIESYGYQKNLLTID